MQSAQLTLFKVLTGRLPQTDVDVTPTMDPELRDVAGYGNPALRSGVGHAFDGVLDT